MEEILRSTANSLAHLGLPFIIEEEEKGIALYTDDETRLRLREHCLEVSRVVLKNPSEKQKSVAFWYENSRPAESTFFLIEKEEEEEVFRLAVRIPIAEDKKVVKKLRLWRTLVGEALRQIAAGEKKIHDGSWGDLKPLEEKEL